MDVCVLSIIIIIIGGSACGLVRYCDHEPASWSWLGPAGTQEIMENGGYPRVLTGKSNARGLAPPKGPRRAAGPYLHNLVMSSLVQRGPEPAPAQALWRQAACIIVITFSSHFPPLLVQVGSRRPRGPLGGAAACAFDFPAKTRGYPLLGHFSLLRDIFHDFLCPSQGQPGPPGRFVITISHQSATTTPNYYDY